jgi:COP9 signalosome complex subunit 1
MHQMGNEDLGKHFERIGELTLAYEAYSKCRADVSSAKHIIEVGLHQARLSLYRQDWSAVMTNVNKMSGLQSDSASPDKTHQTICNILYGIALLGQEKYPEAARNFLQVDPAVSPDNYDQFASPNDVAIYGGLLALATMSRPELSRVLENTSFRTFLELEPHIRRAISQFVNGRYSACLSILESYRADYLLDINLQPHVKELYTVIRCKCIFNFVQPFSCVTIDNLNAAFAPVGGSIEQELVELIGNGTLAARIDAIERVSRDKQPRLVLGTVLMTS